MEIINRTDKTEYLETKGAKPTDYFLTPEQAVKLGAPGDDTLAFYYDPDITAPGSSSPLYDFGFWINKAHLSPTITTEAAFSLYGKSISIEHARVEKIIQQAQPKLADRLGTLASEGYVPQVLVERMKEYVVSDYRFAIYDSFAAKRTSNSGQLKPAGYFSEIDLAFFRPFWSEENVTRQFVHETLHRLSGASSRLREDSTRPGNGVRTSRTGLTTNVQFENGGLGSVHRHRAINEAITEYITNVVMKGEPGAVSPEQRKKDSGKYRNERRILQVIANRISLDVVLNAYTEDYDPRQPNTTENLRKFVKSIREAYGPGFLRQLDEIDREQGVERALAFVKAADYLADKKDRTKKIFRFIAPKKRQV